MWMVVTGKPAEVRQELIQCYRSDQYAIVLKKEFRYTSVVLLTEKPSSEGDLSDFRNE